jgi:hypothetical protein
MSFKVCDAYIYFKNYTRSNRRVIKYVCANVRLNRCHCDKKPNIDFSTPCKVDVYCKQTLKPLCIFSLHFSATPFKGTTSITRAPVVRVTSEGTQPPKPMKASALHNYYRAVVTQAGCHSQRAPSTRK